MGEIKEEPLSDNETEPILSLVEVQFTDKQEQISEPFNFVEVKNEYQVNIIIFNYVTVSRHLTSLTPIDQLQKNLITVIVVTPCDL